MLCCCPSEDSPAQPAEERNQKPNNAAPVKNIQTGDGAVSSSNQNTKSGASLDKSTVSTAKREKSPVTEQPIAQSQSAAANNQAQPKKDANSQDKKAKEASAKPAELSDIKPEIIKSTAVGQSESASKSVSVISVNKKTPGPSEPPKTNPATVTSAMSSGDKLRSVNAQLDKLDKAISEASSKSAWEAKQSIPGLANQLKALTSQVLSTAAGSGKMADQAMMAAVSRLEAVASRLEALASKSGGGGHAAGGDSDAVSPFVLAFDDIVSGPLGKFLSLSNGIGGDVKTQSALVKQAFDAQRAFLVVASKSKQPDQATLLELLKPSAEKLQAVQDFRENNRRSELFNHLSAISESIAALGWVTVAPAPGPFVKEMADAGTFYTNRVLKDYKEKDAKHVEWSRAWIATLTELQGYIKQFHTTGLSWNPQGGDAKSAAAKSGGAPAPPPPAGGGPPPPPPPGPPPPPELSAADDGSAAKAALFADINKGADVTKGLKKVTDDMKTHKNPGLRQGPAPFKASPSPKASPVPAAKPQAAPAKPPLIELQGKKWVVEYHKNNKNIILDKTELKQSVYVFKCEGCTIQVKGKINSIILDSCKKTALVFDDLLSSLEFVNCQSMQAQVTGKLPTLSIDKTDGCMMYLSPTSLDVEIVTAKSSEMNILVPQGDGDFKEFALPEQFKTTYDGKTMVTTATESL